METINKLITNYVTVLGTYVELFFSMKGIFYAIAIYLFLCASVSAQEITVGETQKVKRKSAVVYSQYVTHASLTFPVDSLNKIKAKTGAGKLKIIPADGNQIEMEATIENRSLGKKKARKFIEKYLRLSMENMDGTLEVKSLFEGTVRKRNERRMGIGHMIETPGSKINVVLKVPKEIAIAINDGSGPIEVKQMENDIYIRDRSGRIYIKNTKGSLDVKDGSGGLSIANHEGDLSIKDGSGNIYLNAIGMGEQTYKVLITDKSGGIQAQGLGADVTLKDASGTIRIKNVTGGMKVYDRSGYLSVAEVGKSLEIKDTSGGMYLKDIASTGSDGSQVNIRDSSGRIYLKNVGTSVKIVDKSGGVAVRDVQGNVSISDRSGGISTHNIAGQVSIRDKSGRVTGGSYLVKK